MRLKDPSRKFSSEGDASAEIWDKILGFKERKRARPASSLDVKVVSDGYLIRPPITPPLKKVHHQQTFEENRGKTSRARGDGGSVSHTKFDFSDFEGMTDEEIVQVLYDDPTLAAAAVAAAEKMRKTDSTERENPRDDKSHYYRRNNYKHHKHHSSSRIISPYPDHLRAMMEGGIPVKQWIFLLLLIVLAFYQFNKATFARLKNKLRTKKSEKVITRGNKKKGKRGKAASRPRFKAVSGLKKRYDANVHLSNQISSITQSKVSPKKNVIKQEALTKVKKRRSQQGSLDLSDKGSHDSPDTISTDGSSSVNENHHVQENLILESAERNTISSYSHESIIIEKLDDPTKVSSYEIESMEGKNGFSEWRAAGATDRKNELLPTELTQSKQIFAARHNEEGIKYDEEWFTNIASKKKLNYSSGNDHPNIGEWRTVDIKSRRKVRKSNNIGMIEDGKTDKENISIKQRGNGCDIELKEDSDAKLEMEKGRVAEDGSYAGSSTSTEKACNNTKFEENQTIDDTRDDEAIAIQLQLEEEKLAKHELDNNTHIGESEWEEVITRKKKKGTANDKITTRNLK